MSDLTGRAFISHGAEFPDVRLVAVQPFLEELAGCPHLARVRRLDLSGNHIGAAGAKHLAGSPFLANLRELCLSGNALGSDGLFALLETEWLTQITALELSDNRLGSEDTRAIAERWPGLMSLDLSNNALDTNLDLPSHVQHLRLAACGLHAISLPEALITLDLSRNAFGPHGIAPLVSDNALSLLRYLDLSFNDIENAGAEALATRGDANPLERLNLCGNRITDVSRLVATDSFHAVKDLDLSTNPLGDAAVSLLSGDAFDSLERLCLANCGITDAGVEAFARSGALGGLMSLSLGWNDLGDAGVKALAACPDLAGLVHLDLTGTHLGFAGVIALLESPHLGRLRSLALGENHRLPRDAAMLLHERFGRTAI